VTGLLYSMIASLDGRVAHADGRFDWAGPDEELHRFVVDQERSVGTCLCGRRTYEVMRCWEDMGVGPPGSERGDAGI
jgi:dihydrofolate reductase